MSERAIIPLVSVIMLTHNAPSFVETSIRSVGEYTKDVSFELVVWDNGSDMATRDLVQGLRAEGLIDKLFLSETNLLFAEGNNRAAMHADPSATHYLLLNSDIEVTSSDWLSHLLSIHKYGISTYGIVDHPPQRVDGYCLLIDAALWRAQSGLDPSFQWWWGVTKLQAQLLAAGLSVQGYRDHDDRIIHFGGRSGDAFKSARGMAVSRDEVIGWFEDRKPVILDSTLAQIGQHARRYGSKVLRTLKR